MSDAAWSEPKIVDGPLDRSEQFDRASIAGAVLGLVDETGLMGLTMHHIAGQLQVSPAALTILFPSQEALLDALVEIIVEPLFADPTAQSMNVDWQEYLLQLAHGVRHIALAHPRAFPLIVTRPPAAPWLQPPLRSPRFVEAFLGTLHRCGFSDRRAVMAYRAFASCLFGHLLLEVSALGADIGPVDEPDPQLHRVEKLDAYPRLTSLHHELAQQQTTTEFEEALESLLDRLENDGVR